MSLLWQNNVQKETKTSPKKCANVKFGLIKDILKFFNKDFHLIKRNDTKYFCQSCANKINFTIIFKTNDSLSNSKTNDEAPDNTIITRNSNKNEFHDNCNSVDIPLSHDGHHEHIKYSK